MAFSDKVKSYSENMIYLWEKIIDANYVIILDLDNVEQEAIDQFWLPISIYWFKYIRIIHYCFYYHNRLK